MSTNDNDYRPEIDPRYWAEIEEFVSSAVEDAAGHTAYGPRDLALAASRLALWTWQTAGLPLERDVVFSRDVIARFIAVGCTEFKPSVRGNFRSQLLRMSEALLDRVHTPRRLQPLPAADPAAPYSPSEIASLVSWAETQSTAARRINARILLSLGLDE